MAVFHLWRRRGLCPPDYAGGSSLNLLASIIRARGGRSSHRELTGLPAATLRQYPRLALVVIDGIGERQLGRHLAAGGGRQFWGVHPRRVITTVFPATTAAATTTLTTGASPTEHGVLGWHLHLPDLGLVSTILKATTRTGMPLAGQQFDFARYLALPSPLETTRGQRVLLSFGAIPRSRFSRAGTHWTERRAFQTLTGMERCLIQFARGRSAGLAYAYWPLYDTLVHEYGSHHRRARQHLETIDAALSRLTDKFAGTGTILLVTADHGLVDVPPECRVDLRSVPGFYEALAMLPSGDARQVHCFVRSAHARTFAARIRRSLGHACYCVPGAEILQSGLFGPGRPHPALASRTGDFVLLARDQYAFASPLPDERVDFLAANHGGMSADEMLVPLYVLLPNGETMR